MGFFDLQWLKVQTQVLQQWHFLEHSLGTQACCRRRVYFRHCGSSFTFDLHHAARVVLSQNIEQFTLLEEEHISTTYLGGGAQQICGFFKRRPSPASISCSCFTPDQGWDDLHSALRACQLPLMEQGSGPWWDVLSRQLAVHELVNYQQLPQAY